MRPAAHNQNKPGYFQHKLTCYWSCAVCDVCPVRHHKQELRQLFSFCTGVWFALVVFVSFVLCYCCLFFFSFLFEKPAQCGRRPIKGGQLPERNCTLLGARDPWSSGLILKDLCLLYLHARMYHKFCQPLSYTFTMKCVAYRMTCLYTHTSFYKTADIKACLFKIIHKKQSIAHFCLGYYTHCIHFADSKITE